MEDKREKRKWKFHEIRPKGTQPAQTTPYQATICYCCNNSYSLFQTSTPFFIIIIFFKKSLVRRFFKDLLIEFLFYGAIFYP